MTILILQGPNLNLLGLKSSKSDQKLTLDKVNRAIRQHVRNLNIKLKIIQTHKEYIAINFIQRNRKTAQGLVIIPTSWAKYNQTILETIKLTNIPTASVYFDKKYNFGTEKKDTILIDDNIKSFNGEPIKTIISAIDYIAKS
jgi:3-dehydroquinate dehydratase-2